MPTVMALFQSADDVERAVAELSLNGFTPKDVSVVIFSALHPSQVGRPGFIGWLARGGFLGDTIDRTDGISLMDGTGVGAVIGCLLGLILGSQWRYGPIATGCAGLLLGGLIAYIIDHLIPEKRRDQLETAQIGGLFLVQVSCLLAARSEAAKQLLQSNQAKQLAVLPPRETASPH